MKHLLLVSLLTCCFSFSFNLSDISNLSIEERKAFYSQKKIYSMLEKPELVQGMIIGLNDVDISVRVSATELSLYFFHTLQELAKKGQYPAGVTSANIEEAQTALIQSLNMEDERLRSYSAHLLSIIQPGNQEVAHELFSRLQQEKSVEVQNDILTAADSTC